MADKAEFGASRINAGSAESGLTCPSEPETGGGP